MKRYALGVAGSASGGEDSASLAKEIGREVAARNAILLTGACGGIPMSAAEGAREKGGFVVGISPAHDLVEHEKTYGFPAQGFDFIVFTGFGKKGRNVVFVRSSDALLIVSGRIGTLNEFTIAFDENKVIGVLTGSGGIAESLKQIVDTCGKKTGACIVYDGSPAKLVEKVLEELEKRK